MANTQTYYVDLSLDNSYVGDGTEANMYSWGDVLRWFVTLNASPFDTTDTTLDASVPFDMSSMSVDFRMVGRRTMTSADTIAVTGIQFFLGAFIRFTSHDPATNGVATWTFASGTAIADFIKVTGCTTASIRVQGVLLNVKGPVENLVSMSGLNGDVLLENNVIVLEDDTKIAASSADYGSVTLAGNTVIVSNVGLGQHTLVSSTGTAMSVFASHNIVAQVATSATAVVGFSTAGGNTVHASGNVWAIRPNGAAYSGSYPSAGNGAPDVFGQNLADVIYGDVTLGGTDGSFATILNADTRTTRGCSEFSLTFARAHHSGKGIATVPSQSLTVGSGVGYLDITGKVRAGTIDAGAIQKSGITSETIVHVDLTSANTVRSNAIGTEADPITAADWLLDLQRRAPVDNAVTYVLRGSMDDSAAPLDIALGSGYKYTGSGSVSVTGWKTFNRDLPRVLINSVTMNQAINTNISKSHWEWSGNDDFLTYPSSGIDATGNYLRMSNATVRSSTGNKGRLLVLSTTSPVLHFAGMSCALRHTSAVAAASGYIAIDSDLAHVIALSAFEMGSQTSLMSVPAQTQINGVYAASNLGPATIVGAVAVDSVLEGVTPFQDSSLPDFTLAAGSRAIEIIDTETSIPKAVRDLVEKDARNLERSAFPYGSTAYDAGALETGYKSYPETHLYVDLSKTSTGHVGTAVDKFSYPDLVTWIQSLRGATLVKRYVVHVLRRIEMDGAVLDLSGLVGNPYIGGLTFVTDNGKVAATMVSGTAPTVKAENTEGLDIEFNRMVIGSKSCFGPVSVSAASASKNQLTLKNSVLGWTHSQVGFIVSRSGAFGADESVTVNALEFPCTTSSAGDATDFANLMADIATNSVIGPLVTISEISAGDSYRIAPATSMDITVNGSMNIAAARSVALVDGDTNWTARLGAVDISDVYSRDLSVQSTVVAKSKVSFVATAIENTAAGASKIGIIADSITSIAGIVYPTGATLGTVTGSSTGVRTTTNPVFVNASAGDFDQDDFKLVGASASLAVITGAQLPAWASSLNIDMRGALRFSVPTESIDAGAMEYNGVIPTGTYDPTTQSPVVSRTTLGQAMHMRREADGIISVLNPVVSGSRDLDPFSYKIVGYQLLNAGYTYWQPTQPTEVDDFSGTQAVATITVDAGNSFDASSVITIDYLGKTAVISYTPLSNSTAGFEAGASASATASNIAQIIRSAQIDGVPVESVLWIQQKGATLTLTAKLLGSLGNTITVSAEGTGLSGTTMLGGTDPEASPGQVYPTSGWVPFDKSELPDPYSVSFALKLGVGQANTAFGAIAVMAQVTASPVGSEVGMVVPFALVRMPLESKHERKTISCRVLFT